MAFQDPTDNVISQLTDKARNICARSIIEGLSFSFYGWALGRGGYQSSNPVKVDFIDSSSTALIDQIYPILPALNTFQETDFELASSRSVSCACRIFMDNSQATFGMGELGIFAKINNSPINPSENNEIFLFAIVHYPIQSIMMNTQKVIREVVNF